MSANCELVAIALATRSEANDAGLNGLVKGDKLITNLVAVGDGAVANGGLLSTQCMHDDGDWVCCKDDEWLSCKATLAGGVLKVWFPIGLDHCCLELRELLACEVGAMLQWYGCTAQCAHGKAILLQVFSCVHSKPLQGS